MNTLIVLLTLFFTGLLGFSVLHLLGIFGKGGLRERILFSFGVGVGIMMLQMYFYSRAGIVWDPNNIVVPWGILYIAALLKHSISLPNSRIVVPKSRKVKALFILVVLLGGFTLIESILRPLNAWDGYASWLFRSKMYFVEGSIDPSLVTYLPTEYPPLVSMMGTFLYTFLGQIDDRSILVTYAVFYISLGAIFYNSLKTKSGNFLAILFTFLLLSTQNLIRHSGRFEAGQADVILGYYIFLSFLLFIRVLKDISSKNLLILHFMLLISALIKNDSVPLVLITEFVVLVVTIFRFGFKKVLLSLVFFVPFLDWQYFKHLEGVPSSPEYISTIVHPERIPVVLKEFTKELVNIKNWNLLWIAFVLSMILVTFRKLNTEVFIAFAIIIIDIIVLASVFFVTTPNPSEHIPNVLNRALLHIAPVGVYAICMCSALLKLKLIHEK